MIRNDKGFTMIEILASVIIMGVLLIIAVPAVSKMMKGFRENYYVELEETLLASGKEFFNDNRIFKPNEDHRISYVTIDSLLKKKYIDKFVDYKGKSCSATESYIIMTYGGFDYDYEVCIKCVNDDYETIPTEGSCDPSWIKTGIEVGK